MGKTTINNAPIITVFLRWYGYHSQSWVVYGIVLIKLHTHPKKITIYLGRCRIHPPVFMVKSHETTMSNKPTGHQLPGNFLDEMRHHRTILPALAWRGVRAATLLTMEALTLLVHPAGLGTSEKWPERQNGSNYPLLYIYRKLWKISMFEGSIH